MNSVEINKQYIRDHVSQQQQSLFYDYFLKLEDQHLFQQWSTEKTIKVVNDFKKTVMGKEKQVRPACEVKEAKVKSRQDSSECVEKCQRQKTAENSTCSDRKPSAISLLDEIEQNFDKNSGKFSRSSQNVAINNTQDILWMAFQPSPSKKDPVSLQNKKDPFENFDSFITESPKKEEKTSNENKSVPSSPVTQEKYQLKRSLELPKIATSELKKQKSKLKIELVPKEKGKPLPDKVFKWKLDDELPCRKLPEQTQKLQLQILNHEIVHRTLLPDYVIYHIKVSPTNLICKRTYDDFLQLRTTLEKNCPGIKVPMIDSGSWFSESDITLINTNKISLEQFLNDILSHPTLSRTDVFREFVTVTEQKKIEKVIEDYGKRSVKSCFSDIENHEGIIKFDLSEESNKIIQQLPRWKKTFSNYFDGYSDLVSSLVSQYEAIKLTFSQMMTLSSDFCRKIRQSKDLNAIIGDSENLEFILEKQRVYFNQKRQTLEKDITNMRERYLSILKYEKLNISSFEPMIDSVESLTTKYMKRLENQPESPSSDLYISQLTSKCKRFETDIWHEPESVILHKYQVGYLNCQLLRETQIFNSRLAQNLSNVWGQVFGDKSKESQKGSGRKMNVEARLSH